MSRPRYRRPVRRTTLALSIAAVAGACVPTTPDPRVPLPVPLPAVEGAGPVESTSLFAGLSFGDGFWGQERERAELTGIGFGFTLLDRVELEIHDYDSNRTVDDENGTPHTGSGATTVRIKVRAGESESGDWSLGLVGAYSTSSRVVPGVQDESVTAWDLALPIEYTGAGGGREDPFGFYAGPRFVRQAFESRIVEAGAPPADDGVAWGGVLGLRKRVGWLHVAAEGSLMRAPRLQVGSFGSRDGWIFIPALTGKLVLPIGDDGS